MVRKRPIGVMIIGGTLILFGGLLLLIMICEVIDSLRFYGFQSLLIPTPLAFLGFLVYGGMPIAFYSTGMGLYMGRAWARKSALWVLPVLFFLFMMNFACRVVRAKLHMANVPVFGLFLNHPGVFVDMIFRHLLIVLPIVLYLNNPHVQVYFLEDEDLT